MINSKVWFKRKLIIIVGFAAAGLLVVGFIVLGLNTMPSENSNYPSLFAQNNAEKGNISFEEEVNDYESAEAVVYSTEYIMLNREQMITEADAIMYGVVTNISETKWNQDNGQYWEEITKEDNGETVHAATPFHEIELTVLRPIVDEIGLSDKVTITELGRSPVDIGQTIMINNGLELISDASYNLAVGDEVVVFLEQSEIEWRNPDQEIEWVTKVVDEEAVSYYDVGSRTIIGFVGAPSTAYYIKMEDGLLHSASLSVFQEEPISLAELIQKISKVRPLIE